MELNLSIQNKKSLLSNNMNVEIIITKYGSDKTNDWKKKIEHIDENDWSENDQIEDERRYEWLISKGLLSRYKTYSYYYKCFRLLDDEHLRTELKKEIYIRKALKCIFDSSYIDMCFPDPMVLSHISFEARNKCHCHFAPLLNQTFVITDFDNCVYLNQILELYVEHVSKLCKQITVFAYEVQEKVIFDEDENIYDHQYHIYIYDSVSHPDSCKYINFNNYDCFKNQIYKYYANEEEIKRNNCILCNKKCFIEPMFGCFNRRICEYRNMKSEICNECLEREV